LLPDHQVRHMEECQSLLLVAEHAGQSARCGTCPIWLRMTPGFLL
jgi:hypothetical protein